MRSLKSLTLEEDVDGSGKVLTLYFHYPCFDGLVSCVLASELLANEKRWSAIRFSPVTYEDRKNWSSRRLQAPFAIVDFLFHPKASFWADHHITTFANERLKSQFENRHDEFGMLFDAQAPSCASLLWGRFAKFLDHRYSEMVFWADRIDSANYTSVGEAIFGDAPALQINASLMLKSDLDYCRLLIQGLRSQNLSRVADLPQVRERYEEVRRRREAGLERMGRRVRLGDGDIVTFDIEAAENEVVSRYAPYYFFERARYSIGIVRLDDKIRITAMRNPWLNFESIPLGKVFERFGGGGHQRVASVILPVEQSERVPEIVEQVEFEMRNQSMTERIIA
jgi:hypothetical protein